ncbi:MAG: 3-deoxy-manno-octulosonate cytidylyltransferase [Myxococcaceae bacterium]|nr:3-deoxy-manno-octulosonate cytidylyltransferase [Myxococcaceae bacterium]
MAPRIAVIPARYASTRFPGKPLAHLLGEPMIRHVHRRCLEAACFDAVVVATDDERIQAVCQGFGAEVALTSSECPSGTDRVAEVARARGLGADAVWINVQGDEPAVPPAALRALAAAFDAPAVEMATLVRPLAEADRARPSVVKVVRAESGAALYFSRADLPFPQSTVPVRRWAHVGLYGYRQRTLERLATLAPTELERAERLEQLRALGHGIVIHCVETQAHSPAVDLPEDVAAAEAALRALA